MEQLDFVRDLARILIRRFFLFALVAICGTGLTIWFALSLDRVYEASAIVQIQGPQISTDATNETAGTSVAQRVQQIEQQLRSRDSLFEVAETYDLFRGDEMTVSDRVTLMRESVLLNSIAGVQRGYGLPPDPSALRIVVRLGDAEKSALVANEFVTRLLQRNLQNRERRTADTLAFFRREEVRLGQQISDVDRLIVQYKAENAESLPEGLEFRRDELTRLSEDQREISRQLMTLERERAMLAEGGTLPGDRGLGDPVSVELSRMRIELSRMRVSAPNHPDIPRLRREIEALSEDQSASQLRMTGRQRQLIVEESQLLEAQLQSISARQSELTAFIQATPAVELQLAGYMRDREHLQQQLDAAVDGRSEAEVDQRLEANRQSERFEVLESALVPEYPIEPSRTKIVLAGSAVSIFLAGLLVFALDFLRPVIRSSSQFRRHLGKMPTISLPHISTVWERRRRRLLMTMALLMVVAGLPLSLLLIDQLVFSFEEMAEVFDQIPVPPL